MDLQDYRKQIDEVDSELLRLFTRRMEICSGIAKYKMQNGIPIFDAARERAKLADLYERTDEEMRSYTNVLFSLMFELSRLHQKKIINPSTELMRQIESAIEETDKCFPENALIACQGVEGAYSQLACEKLFTVPNIMYFSSFEGVFSAIDKGLCRYGVLPIENSTAGSVNKIYDLMMRYDFSIVRSVRLKVDHNLLAKKGTKLSDIKEIFSHEQAINQCAGFLSGLKNVKVTVCENTATAAKMVAQSERSDIAALSSRSSAEIYGLDCLCASVQDTGNNYTRFICLSKKLEIYAGADKTSIMMVVSHKPGSLYKVLSRFYAMGINLVKLESRPIPDRDFEFMFYFDLETPVYSDKFTQLIGEMDSLCEKFKYLGSYSEMV